MNIEDRIKDENQRIRYLRIIVDLNLNLIASGTLTKKEAIATLDAVRNVALRLFPGKGNVFDLVYRPRFLRLIEEAFPD